MIECSDSRNSEYLNLRIRHFVTTYKKLLGHYMLIKPNGTIRDQFKIPPKLIDTYNEIPISEKNCFSRRSTHYLQVYFFAIFSNDCERFCVLI